MDVTKDNIYLFTALEQGLLRQRHSTKLKSYENEEVQKRRESLCLGSNTVPAEPEVFPG